MGQALNEFSSMQLAMHICEGTHEASRLLFYSRSEGRRDNKSTFVIINNWSIMPHIAHSVLHELSMGKKQGVWNFNFWR